jgi:hypothetical protein
VDGVGVDSVLMYNAFIMPDRGPGFIFHNVDVDPAVPDRHWDTRKGCPPPLCSRWFCWRDKSHALFLVMEKSMASVRLSRDHGSSLSTGDKTANRQHRFETHDPHPARLYKTRFVLGVEFMVGGCRVRSWWVSSGILQIMGHPTAFVQTSPTAQASLIR